jgi:cholesterol transport system auxiliary component
MIAAGKRKFAGAIVALAAAVVASCSLGPQRQHTDSYDLGPPRLSAAAGPSIAATLLLPDVSAPSWLDGHGIVYRLSYDNNARPQAYASSRWVAPPAALLTQRLRSRLAAGAGGIVTSGDGARADYALRIELEDFSQAFSDANASRVVLRARASLVRLADRQLVAQRVFSVDRPAPTPDARGAVAALGEASDEVIENLVEWTGGQIKAPRPK